MEKTWRITPTIVVAFLGLLLFLIQGAVISAWRGYIYVVGDSCGYEVARALVDRYGLRGEVVSYHMFKDRTFQGDVVVILFTNATTPSAFTSVLEFLRSTSVQAVVTDVFYNHLNVTPGVKLNVKAVISSEDLWFYCVYEDEEALNRVARLVRSHSTHWYPPDTSILVAVALVTISVAVSQLEPSTREFTKRGFRKLLTLVLSLFAFLHVRIRKEELFEHPLRSEILKLLASRGELSFSELQRILGCSRGTLEWHLNLLLRAKAIVEVRYGNKRIYKLGDASVFIPDRTELSFKRKATNK